jgi:hypothetical protein
MSDTAKIALEPLDPEDIFGMLRAVANRIATPIMQKRFDEVQGKPAGSAEYLRHKSSKYGSTANMEKTGRFKAAVDGPTEDRKITIGRHPKGGYRLTVGIVRIVDGVNIYDIAQKGGRGGVTPVMQVAKSESEDTALMADAVKDESVRMLQRRGVLS